VTTWDPEGPYEPDLTIDGPFMLRKIIQYGILLAIGAGLALASTRIAGGAGVALAVLALLFIVIAVWSILFMTVIEWLRRKISKLNGE
jgi:hypothetical protein